ncbi:MAG: LruC domain-containing protein [Candidatus Cloacimonadaceae bacterium]|nr:LruC domain-containing protein [Candidatus Cloacimonadaceae bacterium]
MKRIIILALLIAGLGVALWAQGTLVVWGTTLPELTSNIPTGNDFIAVAGGEDFAVGLRSNGTLAAWGKNNNNIVSNTPTGNGFIAVSAGVSHAIALRANGTIAAWGNNNNNVVDGTPTANNFVKIAAGPYHNLALRTDGTVVAWGDNSRLQVSQTPASETFIDIAAGHTFSVAVRSDGSIAFWGNSGGGNSLTPVPAGNDFVEVSAKYLHVLARKANGTIVAWGNATQNLNVPAGTYIKMSAGWQGNLAMRPDGSLVAWANLWVLRTIPAWVQELDIAYICGGYNYSLGITGSIDSDGDGVPDNLDQFPDDPLRAYIVNYPLNSPTGWGTLAFEDMWPQKGDYDFNDLVLDYQLQIVMNAAMHVKDIKANLKLRAVGATYQNAFAIEFPFPVSAIESLAGIGAGAPYNMPLIEAGAHSILKVISNTNDFVSVPGHDVFWNTQPGQPSFAPIPISFELTLVNPFNPNTAPDWGMLNPYLMVNRVLGHEIHLPGYPPTIHADASLFGMDDDTTDPISGRFYKTASNLPWAIDIPVSWKYPIERKQITHAYYGFAPWAESGGNTNQNWYELIPGQIDINNIYNP